MIKFYIKSDEMLAHGCGEGRAFEYALKHGIVRMELELKRRELSDLGWSNFNEFLKAWDMGTVHQLFAEYEAIMQMKAISNDAEFLESLPQQLRVIAALFLEGRDVKSLVSRATFYRHRKALLEFGIDISDERPERINCQVRTINIEPVQAPDWYWKAA